MGGIFVSGTVTAVSSTISGNSTTGMGSEGGGIYGGTVSLTNTTVADNFTTGDQSRGGGVFGNSVTSAQSTFTGNSTAGTSSGGGGIYGGTVSLNNSLVLGNASASSSNQQEVGINAAIVPFVIFNGVNIVGTGNDTDASDGVINADPTQVFNTTQALLYGNGGATTETSGVIANNGGMVQTAALLANLTNPAIDSGTGVLPQDTFDLDADMNVSNSLPLDARDFARAVDVPGIGSAVPDIGAFEAQITATPGPDFSVGGAGSNTQQPGDGDDLILGSPGADPIDGGDGIDTVDFSSSASRVLVFLSGGGTEGDAEGDTFSKC